LKTAFHFVSLLTLLVLIAAMSMVFYYAPVEREMGVVQKIFYVHVPAAMAMYAGFLVACLCSIFYLIRSRPIWDIWARAGVEVGMYFCVFVMISGPIWASKAWGKAWVKDDPQLMATFVLFLLYGGYLMLRAFSGPGKGVKKIAAVLAVIAAVDIPVIHWAVRKWGGMHPVVEREGGEGLADGIAAAFQVSMLSFLLLFVVLLWMQVRVGVSRDRLDRLYLTFEDVARSKI
jgi:heme exporter protein C